MTHTINETTVNRDSHNRLRVRTIIDMGFDRRELHIETDKGYRGGIETSATCYQITEDGCGRQHAFGLAGGGDFSKQLKVSPARGTEKALLALHTEAMTTIEDTVKACVEHYVKPEPVLDALPHHFSTLAGSL